MRIMDDDIYYAYRFLTGLTGGYLAWWVMALIASVIKLSICVKCKPPEWPVLVIAFSLGAPLAYAITKGFWDLCRYSDHTDASLKVLAILKQFFRFPLQLGMAVASLHMTLTTLKIMPTLFSVLIDLSRKY